MKELPVIWYRNPADRFNQLLETHSWNEAVRILKREKAENAERIR